MECKICFEKFNDSTFMPMICLPCAHTFCSTCVSHLSQCSLCREPISGKRPNFNLLEVLEERTEPRVRTSARSRPKSNQEALQLKNEGMELSKQKKYVESLVKFDESLSICTDNYPEKYSLLWWKVCFIL